MHCSFPVSRPPRVTLPFLSSPPADSSPFLRERSGRVYVRYVTLSREHTASELEILPSRGSAPPGVSASRARAIPLATARIARMPARSTHLLDAIPRFPEPSRTRSARSTGTCRGLPARPMSRKCARWRRSSRGGPFSTAGRPSANRAPLAEIHLRCTSAKGFRTVGTESRKARGSRGRREICRCIESREARIAREIIHLLASQRRGCALSPREDTCVR